MFVPSDHPCIFDCLLRRCGRKQTGLSGQLENRNVAARLQSFQIVLIPVWFHCHHCFQFRKLLQSPPPGCLTYRHSESGECPLPHRKPTLSTTAKVRCNSWPSTSLQVKLQHFGLKVIVYASQEVFNVPVHPSWTNNHRNSRNALGKLLLLLEIISVKYFYRGEGVRWREPQWNMVQPPHSRHYTVWLVWQDLLFCKAIAQLWRYFNNDS